MACSNFNRHTFKWSKPYHWNATATLIDLSYQYLLMLTVQGHIALNFNGLILCVQSYNHLQLTGIFFCKQ